MSENLLKIGQLVEHQTDAAQVGRMLEAIRQNIGDAKAATISAETRFEAAYRAITQCAMVALWANGFRPSKSVPGHHMTLIQMLPNSIGLEVEQMRLLDTFRVKRNAIDYSGDCVDTESLLVEARQVWRFRAGTAGPRARPVTGSSRWRDQVDGAGRGHGAEPLGQVTLAHSSWKPETRIPPVLVAGNPGAKPAADRRPPRAAAFFAGSADVWTRYR